MKTISIPVTSFSKFFLKIQKYLVKVVSHSIEQSKIGDHTEILLEGCDLYTSNFLKDSSNKNLNAVMVIDAT